MQEHLRWETSDRYGRRLATVSGKVLERCVRNRLSLRTQTSRHTSDFARGRALLKVVNGDAVRYNDRIILRTETSYAKEDLRTVKVEDNMIHVAKIA